MFNGLYALFAPLHAKNLPFCTDFPPKVLQNCKKIKLILAVTEINRNFAAIIDTRDFDGLTTPIHHILIILLLLLAVPTGAGANVQKPTLTDDAGLKALAEKERECKQRGDYRQAYYYCLQYLKRADSLYDDVIRRNMDDVDLHLQSQRLQRETQQHEIELKELRLKQTAMQHERLTMEQKAQQLKHDSISQQLQSASLTLQQQRQQLRLRDAEHEQEESARANELHRLRNWNTRATIFVSIAGLAIVLFTYLLLRVRKASKHLRNIITRLNQERLRARHSIEMKKLFIQNMSHDVRTPVNAVMGFSQILSVPGLDLAEEEKAEYRQHIHNNSRILKMLVNDLLNIHNIESGQYEVTLADVSMNEMARAALSTVEYRVPPGVELRMTTDVDDAITINTDGKRVQQVLMNFLTNACKHTTEGSITVHAALDEARSKAVFSVTDTGTGIPEDEAEIIFERFTKLDNLVQGTGLGLNICTLIAKRLQGRVWCDAKHKGGARFLLELPMRAKGAVVCLLLALMPFLTPSLQAQTKQNAYGIDNECYLLMKKALSQSRDSAAYFSTAQRMRALAVKKQDWKAECVALQLPVNYYYRHENYRLFNQACDVMRTRALQTRQWPYYYTVYEMQVVYEIYRDDYHRAFQLTKEMGAFAHKNKDKYGNWYCWKNAANIYFSKNQFVPAQKYMLMALEEHDRQGLSTSPVSVLQNYVMTEQLVSGKLRIINEGMKHCTNVSDSLSLLNLKAYAYAQQGNKEAFLRQYSEVEQVRKRYKINRHSLNGAKLLPLKAACDGDSAAVHKLVDALRISQTRNEVGMFAYALMGDYTTALSYAEKYRDIIMNLFQNGMQCDLHDLTDEILNDELLSKEAAQRLLALNLTQQQQQMIMRNDALSNDTLRLSNISKQRELNFAVRSKQYYDDRMKTEQATLAAKRLKQQAEFDEMRHNNILLNVSAFSLTLIAIIVLIATIYLLRIYRRMRNSLAEIHRLSSEAIRLNQQEDDFLNSMSGEVRTPLDSVMSLSAQLADPDCSLSDEDRMAYGERIVEDSTQIILRLNDILLHAK